MNRGIHARAGFGASKSQLELAQSLCLTPASHTILCSHTHYPYTNSRNNILMLSGAFIYIILLLLNLDWSEDID